MAEEKGRPMRRQDADMARAKAKRIRRDAADAMTETLRQAQESGELRHLYGQRLDLSDDSPEWFAHNLLKREGVAPPAIERAKDIDKAQQETEALLERLRRRRAWLSSPESGRAPDQAAAFNRARARVLDEYREALTALNRAIRDYNLTSPPALHRYGFRVDQLVDQAHDEIPPLPEDLGQPSSSSASAPERRRAPWRRWWRRDGT